MLGKVVFRAVQGGCPSHAAYICYNENYVSGQQNTPALPARWELGKRWVVREACTPAVSGAKPIGFKMLRSGHLVIRKACDRTSVY